MGLFDAAVIAAAFKTTTETDNNTGEWTVVKSANPYGTKQGKNELAIAALPGDFQIYRFTIPIKQNKDYKDFHEFDEIQAINTLELTTDGIRETQLVGKQEWMQQWDSTHERLNLGEIKGPYSADVRINYFQNVTKKTKRTVHYLLNVNNQADDDPPRELEVSPPSVPPISDPARFEAPAHTLW
jgi:hypothetical protein